MSIHMSKCHIVENHVSKLNYNKKGKIIMLNSHLFCEILYHHQIYVSVLSVCVLPSFSELSSTLLQILHDTGDSHAETNKLWVYPVFKRRYRILKNECCCQINL